MRTIPLYVFLSLLAIGAISCKGCDDDVPCNDPTDMDCANYDPCHDRKTPVSADFEVWVVNYNESVHFVSGDTVMEGGVRFVALDSTSGTTYRWQVGNPQNTSTGISYSLLFRCDDVLDQTIPIQLIAERLADSTCLAEADRRDTVIRNIHFVSLRAGRYWGRWEGALESKPNEVFTVELGFSEPFDGDCGDWDTLYVKNLGDNCLRRLRRGFFNYQEALFDEAVSSSTQPPFLCPPPAGVISKNILKTAIKVDESDSISIRFTQQLLRTEGNGGNVYEDFVFKGRRVD